MRSSHGSILKAASDQRRFVNARTAIFAGESVRTVLELPVQDVVEFFHIGIPRSPGPPGQRWSACQSERVNSGTFRSKPRSGRSRQPISTPAIRFWRNNDRGHPWWRRHRLSKASARAMGFGVNGCRAFDVTACPGRAPSARSHQGDSIHLPRWPCDERSSIIIFRAVLWSAAPKLARLRALPTLQSGETLDNRRVG